MAVGVGFGVLWQLPLIVGPWVFGRAIDAGIVGADPTAVAVGAGVLLLVTLIGAVFGISLHTLVVRSWLISLYGTTKMVTRKAAQMGHVLPRRSPTGEILSVASSDSDEFGAMTEIIARAGSQLVSFLAVAAIVMATSPRLGVTVLLAAPGPGRRRAAVPAPAPPPPGARAHPQLRADLDGHRHRRRAPDPARHRRRADLRPQLRQPSRRARAPPASRPASGRPSSRRWACCSPASSWCCCCGSAPTRCWPAGSRSAS